MTTEEQLERYCIDLFKEGGWSYLRGSEIAPEESGALRADYREAALLPRLQEALRRLNPTLPAATLEEVTRTVTKLSEPTLELQNRALHRLLLEGVAVSYREGDGVTHDVARLIDFERVGENDFLVVNQFTVRSAQVRRPDIVVFINGLPLSVIELKNPGDEHADIWQAYQQLQTYKGEVSDLFIYNAALVISDGLTARVGSLTAPRERFMPWKTVKDENDRPQVRYEIDTVIRGFFDRTLFLDYIRHFVLFEDTGDRLIKKIAGYHQFHAAREAARVTMIAAREAPVGKELAEGRATYGKQVAPGSRKAGVVWHTQGSGKSISMVCYVGKLLQQPEMRNPTIVVVTDRNDLDGQLYETFCAAQDLLKQQPEQAESRKELREKLASRQAGGIIFTTIHKFSLIEGEKAHPALCDRSNVVVLSDEAHRSQYGLKAKLNAETGAYVYGYAKHLRDAMPQASFIGFTGTPIAQGDRDTRAVFGDYVSIYDIQDAVEDGATVEIYYESRLAKLDINQAGIEALNEAVEEIVEQDESLAAQEKAKSEWSTLEKLVGAQPRMDEVAQDLVAHFEARSAVVEGKAMIVCMGREICARMYQALVALRPDWHGDSIDAGAIKVVMTGSASDPELLRPHVTNKREKKTLEKRFKAPEDSLRLVIVRDMWLTGFDAPCCHTMYVDKPMKGHNLMQAIARVNRVFKDKPGGLVVDYIGIGNDLKAALKDYSDSKGRGQPTHDAGKALDELLRRIDICRGLFHGFDYSGFETRAHTLLAPAANHLLGLEEGKKRFLDVVTQMTRAFSLCGTLDQAQDLKIEIAFFTAVKAMIVKSTSVDQKLTDAERDSALKAILDNAVVSEGVADIFALAGIDKPNIGLLSDEFLEDARNMPHQNLAVELLEKLIKDGIKARAKTNVAQRKKYGDRLLETLRKYHNRAIETAQVIEELIQMAKDFQAAMKRDDALGLSPDEIAFYDALAERPEVLEEMGDETLKKLATELTEKLRKNVTVDWQKRESVRAKIRLLIRRLLRQYGYPPAGREGAADRVIEQAETLADQWAA